jgi:hypothetical protein
MREIFKVGIFPCCEVSQMQGRVIGGKSKRERRRMKERRQAGKRKMLFSTPRVPGRYFRWACYVYASFVPSIGREKER